MAFDELRTLIASEVGGGLRPIGKLWNSVKVMRTILRRNKVVFQSFLNLNLNALTLFF